MLYFAYGSNMYTPRLQARVPSAERVAVARLPGHALAFRKLGGDGSTKCDIEPNEPETVWGVVFRIDTAERDRLDAAEGSGYRAERVTVSTGSRFLDVFTYRARPDWIGEGRPWSWYRDLVLAGAREHELSPMYVAAIGDIEAAEDSDTERDALNRQLL